MTLIRFNCYLLTCQLNSKITYYKISTNIQHKLRIAAAVASTAVTTTTTNNNNKTSKFVLIKSEYVH